MKFIIDIHKYDIFADAGFNDAVFLSQKACGKDIDAISVFNSTALIFSHTFIFHLMH